MSESTNSPRPRKPLSRPKKPYPDFPLTPHPSGTWCKKIRGRVHHFGRWFRRLDGVPIRVDGNGWEDALAEYKKVADDLHAGRTPRVAGDGLVVSQLCNHFLTAKLRKKDAGEMNVRSFRDYKEVCDLLVGQFGGSRLVGDLASDDFGALRASMAKKWGPVRLGNAITRIKSVFTYGYEAGLMDRPVRYGPEFAKPGKAILRKHRAKAGPRMMEADDLRAVIDGALVVGETGPELVRPDPRLRAMILLALNGGFGNNDCATLTLSDVNPNAGWIDFARPKTGVNRRVPLWAETAAAVADVIDNHRATPATHEACGRVFLTPRGQLYVRSREVRDEAGQLVNATHKDRITIQFTGLLKRLGLHRPGLSFYSLRHVFRTVADAVRDRPAVDHIMGHSDPSMRDAYVERIDDARLRAVVDHVRAWLFGESPQV